jgi:small conductance mechanosensitive channel
MFDFSVANLREFWQDLALQWGLSFLKAAAILVVGWFAARATTGLLARFLRGVRLDPTLIGFLTSMAYAFVLIVVGVAVLAQLGVQTASLVAVLGAIGLALSLQSSLANLASGIMILLFRLFRVGDTIEISNVRGRVLEILVFQTILISDDGQRVFVPNAKITAEIVRHRPAEAAALAHESAAPGKVEKTP